MKIHILLEIKAWKNYASNIRYAKRCDRNVSSRTIYLRNISTPVCWTVQRVLSENSIASHWGALKVQRSEAYKKKRTGDRKSETESERGREGDESSRSVEVYKRVRDSNVPHSSWRTITSIHRIRYTDADTWLFRYICPMALSLKWHRESGRDRGRDGERKRQRCDPHPLRPPFPVVALSIINLEKPLIPGALLFRHHFGLTASNDVKLILAANAWRRMKNELRFRRGKWEMCESC